MSTQKSLDKPKTVSSMPLPQSRDTLNCLSELTIEDKSYAYYSLKVAEQTLGDLSHLPRSVRVLLENLLRHEDEISVTIEDMRALSAFHALRKNPPPIAFRPARFLIQDEAATSVLTDMATLRDALADRKVDPLLLSPRYPTDVVAGFVRETAPERQERLSLLRWGAQAFANLRLISPGKGEMNALNAGFLSPVVQAERRSEPLPPLLFPDSVFGSSRRLPVAGGLGVLAFPADALDVEALWLDSHAPLSFSGVLGIKIEGRLSAKSDSTSAALALLKTVRQTKTAGKIIEFYGAGLDHLSVPDRLVIADILCESGALSVFFPIDRAVLDHLELSGKSPAHIAVVEAYAREQGLWQEPGVKDSDQDPYFTTSLTFNLNAAPLALGGPGRACNAVPVGEVSSSFTSAFPPSGKKPDPLAPIHYGDVIWACIGPSGSGAHPFDLILGGLAARKARRLGLTVRPWVRAVLNVPCPALRELLAETGLKEDFESLGFVFVKDGETPPISENIVATIEKEKLPVCAVASGPNEKEGPLHPLCQGGYLASPSLVVCYALAGNMAVDLPKLAFGPNATFQDIFPTASELTAFLKTCSPGSFYAKQTKLLFGEDALDSVPAVPGEPLFPWPPSSPLIKRPSFVRDLPSRPAAPIDIADARAIAVFGDDVQAEQILPDLPLKKDSLAGKYLMETSTWPTDPGKLKKWTGNEDLMVRAAFTHPSLANLLAPGLTGGFTIYAPSGAKMSIFEAALLYKENKKNFVVLAGQNYGNGPGQEWAAKATRLLGVGAVIAESFAPACRLNLIRVGVLPLQIKQGISLADLSIKPDTVLSFAGLSLFSKPPAEVMMTVDHTETVERYMLRCCLETDEEMETWRQGSLWAEALRNLIMLAV